MDSFRFDEMKEAYLDEVSNIYNYYVLNTTATFQVRALSREEMKETLFFKDSKYKAFAIFADNSLCGYVLMKPYKKREAYNATAEVSVYLKSDYKGKGLGRLAISYIEDFAKKQGMHVLLAHISGLNEASINMIEKIGYNRCAHYKEVGQKFGQLLDIVAYQKIIS